MFSRYGVHGFAELLFLVGEVEQRPNLLDGKAEITRAPCERKAADIPG
jgi:hypothetical protein